MEVYWMNSLIRLLQRKQLNYSRDEKYMNSIKALIFDAFGTLFKVTTGGSAKTIIKHIEDATGVTVDEKE